MGSLIQYLNKIICSYRIQEGSFDDFAIDSETGIITVSRKLDYDKMSKYSIEIVASDLGRFEREST